MRAREIMSSPVMTGSPWSTLKHIADLMLSAQIGCVPIVDVKGQLLGVVTEADVISLQSLEDPRLHMTRQPVHEPAAKIALQIMSTDVATADEDEDVTSVAREMLRKQVRHVIVIAGRTIVGIISRRDILRALARSDESIRRELTAMLAENAGLLGPFDAEVEDGVVTLRGPMDERSRQLVEIVARSIPGVVAVHFAAMAEP